MQIQTPLSPGEFFDKFTILVNKVYCCEDGNNVMWAMIGIVELATAARSVMEQSDWEQIRQTLLDLRNVNKELWALEHEVRRREPKDLEGIANDSIDIRVKNNIRWNVKRVMNEMLDGTLEVKEP